ncbi:hypothetical protein [Mesorhizobium sp. M7A.F.Ca.US.008.03.1.1]|uniref:hypothetical protein n=1 Tax=Mesorhizobium sp. M7A.F.Ca.US.008.03.1.1 TaxID=2496742 RepID=UPI000FCAA3F4|nr:hypothetical protein [Mesorhizobium sp. M7A.F.Ca.US.008.03.1.1]RUW61443.1 hypothetical protein EOA16_14010 [Mesorhizobium sp. M7A.F.Ca.US.008.03.1.1]
MAAVPGAVAQGGLGQRSVILALSAFAAGALAITILVAIPNDASTLAQNIATGFFMAVFLLAAPLAHITGAVFGVMALVRSNDSRALGVLGIILNGLSVMAGLAILAMLASTIGAFT